MNTKNPNFIFSEQELAQKNVTANEIKPNLMGDKTSTDMRFDLLANQNKINFQIHNSPLDNDSDVLSSDKSIEYSNEEVKSPDQDSIDHNSVLPNGNSVVQNGHNVMQNGHNVLPNGNSVVQNGHNVMQNGHNVLPNGNASDIQPSLIKNESILQSQESERVPQMTSREIRGRKIELLRIFAELKEKGYNITPYTINANLEDMEQEYSILKNMQNKKNSIKLYKSFIMNTVGAMEFMNDNYNPFDFHLSGWNDHESKKMESGYYDDVLEEVHEKYKSSGKQVEPEIKLLLMMLASGATFHASQSINIPGIDKLLERNPSIANNFASDNSKKQETHFPTLNKDKQMKGPDAQEFLNNMRRNVDSNKHTTTNTSNKSKVSPTTNMKSQTTMPPPPRFFSNLSQKAPFSMEASLVESDSVTRSSQQRKQKKDSNSSERRKTSTLKMSI